MLIVKLQSWPSRTLSTPFLNLRNTPSGSVCSREKQLVECVPLLWTLSTGSSRIQLLNPLWSSLPMRSASKRESKVERSLFATELSQLWPRHSYQPWLTVFFLLREFVMSIFMSVRTLKSPSSVLKPMSKRGLTRSLRSFATTLSLMTFIERLLLIQIPERHIALSSFQTLI